MPTPVSRTVMTAWAPHRSAISQMCPSRSVYLAALFKRFVTAWASRIGSASSLIGVSGRTRVNSWPPAFKSAPLVSTAERSTAPSSTRSLRSSSRLLVIRATSTRSSISRAICRTCRSIADTAHCDSGASAASRFRIWTALRIGASGLRSSWARIARNSFLDRSTVFKVSSVRLRSVISTSTLTAPRTFPDPSRIGLAWASTVRRWPSGRSMTIS